MARISGVDLPRNKRVEIGLTYVFGIGNTSANKIGIGELTINCVHKDGTRSGFDTELLGLALEYTEIPVTIVGGASSLQELEVLSKKYQSIGLGVGSLFVYKGKKNAVLISYSENLTNKNS